MPDTSEQGAQKLKRTLFPCDADERPGALLSGREASASGTCYWRVRHTRAGAYITEPCRRQRAQGQAVRTVEGLSVGSEPLHPVQQAFWEHHALQCGFCTAGFLMLATSIVESDNVPTDQELTDVLASNLCRCTGYQNIKKAVCSAIEATRK